MYTTELLEEKARAQRRLSEKTECESKPYEHVVEEEVGREIKSLGKGIRFSNRKGGFTEPPNQALSRP